MKYALITLMCSIFWGEAIAQSIEQRITSAERKMNQDDWVGATKDFKKLVDGYSNEMSALQKAKVYNDLGYLSMRLLDAQEAEYFLNLSIINHEEAGIPDKLAYANALQHMGQLFIQTVQFDIAKNYVDQAIEVIVADRGRDNSEFAIARTYLAAIYEEVGYLDLAYEIYFDSHESLKKLGAISPEYAEACNHMGRILIRQGQPKRAEEYINESTVIYKQLGKNFDVERAESLEGLGNFYEQLGRYEDAEKTLLEALEIKRAIPNEANILIIETLNDLGILYRHLGDDRKAEKMFLEVVKECEEELTTDHPFYATAKNNLATIAMQNDENDKAKTLLEEALATYDKKYGPNHPLSANTLNNLARVHRAMGDTDLSEVYYKRVLALDEKLYGKRHPDYATTLMNLAILYSASGRVAEADQFYTEALDIRKEVLGKNNPTYYRALENVGLHAIANEKMDDAERYFREAIEIQIYQIQSIFPALPIDDKLFFYERLREDVDRYNYIAFQMLDRRPELVQNIFDFQNQTKAILFTPNDKVESRIVNGSDAQLRSDYFEWKDQKLRLANYYRIGETRLKENNIDLNEVESDIEVLERSITSKLPEFQNLFPNTSVGWTEVMQKVQPDEAIVELVKIREFKSQKNESGIVFGFTNLSQYLAIIFKQGISAPSHTVIGDRFVTDDRLSISVERKRTLGKEQEIFSEVWEPIHKQVGASISSLKVSPDGFYHQLNPNTLQTSPGSHLIDSYFTSYLTSCNDLFREDQEVLSRKTVLIGNPDFKGTATTDQLNLKPLVNSELEIQSLSAILQPKNWDARVYSRKDASELRLRSSFNPTILHINSHGFYSEKDFISWAAEVDNPQFKSGIFLSGASNTFNNFAQGREPNGLNDGMLTASEAMGLDLGRTKLVVLSAPQAGTGSEINREGIFGLQRAFMVAGAQNLIAKFNRADETASTELMVLFYHKFMETNDISESLKFAQLKLRTKYSDPSIWGSYMLIGNG